MTTSEQLVSRLIEERDQVADVADQLAAAVARLLGREVGEGCNTWQTMLAATESALADQNPVREAGQRGYDRAVATLRDDERYRGWWSSAGCIPHGPVRQHFADYLEIVRDLGLDRSHA